MTERQNSTSERKEPKSAGHTSKGFSADSEVDSSVEGRDLSESGNRGDRSVDDKKTEEALKNEG